MQVPLPVLPRIDASSNLGPRISEVCGLEDIKKFAVFQTKLEKIANGEWAISHASQIGKEELRKKLARGDEFSDIIESRRDASLLLMLYRESLDLYKSRPINKLLFQTIEEFKRPISGGLLRSFIKFYLEQYDRFEERELLAEYIFIKLKELLTRARVPQDIKRYHDDAKLLFTRNAVQYFVERAKGGSRKREGLVALAKELKIPHAGNARFFELATQVYYLETLKSLTMGAESPVMAEIKNPSVKESIAVDGMMIGQLAAKILIEKCLHENVAMPDNWRDFVLSICSDPRVPRSNRHFAKWWAALDSKLVEAMRRWLSKLDLALFLTLLEDHARRSGNSDMQRMLPARKKFLEGLLEENLVRNSRLILSSEAERSLRRSIHRDNLPVFATLNGGEVCMIYLDLGTGSLIEGSHNFSARVYTDFNIPGLADYSRSSFYPYQITAQKTFKTIPHNRSNRVIWQYKLIQTLKSKPIGLNFSPEKVLTRSDWTIYRKEWGMN